MAMNDPLIRSSLLSSLCTVLPDFVDGQDIIVSEMGLNRGESIIDIAVINGCLHGFEIKSDEDNLIRLSRQIKVYEKYFAYLTIVTTNKHLKHIRHYYPKWIGILLSEKIDGHIRFKYIRSPKKNNRISSLSIVQLLWKREALDVLKSFGYEKGYKNKTKDFLLSKICEILDIPTLVAQIKKAVILRSNWQVVQQPL